jgi:hypothetical protein
MFAKQLLTQKFEIISHEQLLTLANKFSLLLNS